MRYPRTGQCRKKGGFTLIESLVSILLLGIVLAGGMSFFFYSDEAAALVMRKKLAAEMAGTRLEELRAAGYAALPEQDDPESASLAVGDLAATRTVAVTDIDPDSNGITDYKQVAVTVTWNEVRGASARNVTFTTIMTP